MAEMADMEREPISSRIVRLNQLFLEKISSNLTHHLLSRETLLDALFLLYEEVNECDSLKKDKNAIIFIENFRTLIPELKKLRINIGDFETKKVIGRGHFGDVLLVREKQNGDVYAMKVLRKCDTLSQQNVAFYEEERDIMAKSNSPWITKLEYAFQDKHNLYLVMEFHVGGDLLALLERHNNVLDEDTARFFLAEITLCIQALHNMGYVHRDVKADNILVDRTGHLKLADFGSAAKLSEQQTVTSVLPVGTPDYIAPEVLSCIEKGRGTYGKSCDWWSLGVLAYEMLFGYTPFADEKVVTTYASIMNHKETLSFPEDIVVSDAALHLIKGLLIEATSRLTYEGLTSHPFFSTIDWGGIREKAPPFVPMITSQEDTSNFEEFGQLPKKRHDASLLAPSTGFSTRDLPFVGFTFTKSVDCSLDRSCSFRTATSSPQKSITALNSLLTSSKREQQQLLDQILSMRQKLQELQLEKDRLARLLDEQKQVAKSVENEAESVNSNLAHINNENACLKRLLEMERTERVNTEKKALQLIADIKEKWKRKEQQKAEKLENENSTLKACLDDVESKYKAAAMEFLTVKNELVKAVKSRDDIIAKYKEYKNKVAGNRRSSTGHTLQLELSQMKLTELQQRYAESERLRLESEKKSEAMRETADELERRLAKLEKARIAEDKVCSKSLRVVEDNLNVCAEQLETMKAQIKTKDCQLKSAENTIEELNKRNQHYKKQILEMANIMNNSVLAPSESSRTPPVPASRTHVNNGTAKLTAQLQELQAELEAYKTENQQLLEELQATRDSDSEKTQTVDELRAVVDRLENGLRLLDRNRSSPQSSAAPPPSNPESSEVVLLQAQISKLEKRLECSREIASREKMESQNLRSDFSKCEKELKDVKIDLRIAQRENRISSQQLSEFQNKEAEWIKVRQELETMSAEMAARLAELQEVLDANKNSYETDRCKWESEKARLDERVENLQKASGDLNSIREKFDRTEGRAQQMDKHVRMLEEQLSKYEEEKSRWREREDSLRADLKEQRRLCQDLEENKILLQENALELDDQMKEMQSCLDMQELETKRFQDEADDLREKLFKLEDEVRAASHEANRQKAKLQAITDERDELRRQLETCDLVKDTEMSVFISQRDSYKDQATSLTQTAIRMENELKAFMNQCADYKRKCDGFQCESVRLKEEAAGLITQIGSLRNTNQKLSTALEESAAKEEKAKEKIKELENTLQSNQANTNFKMVQFEETFAQQSKLINFLQTKLEEMELKKKKKTFQEKLFGRKDPVPISPTLIRKAKRYVPPTFCPSTKNCESSNNQDKCLSPQSQTILTTLTQSPGTQDNPNGQSVEKGISKLSVERMHHSIPHRFSVGLSVHPTKCASCLDSIHFGRNVARCEECHVSVHPKCSSSLPNSCGLPMGLMQHFRHSMRQQKKVEPANGSSSSGENGDPRQLEGWMKIPKSGSQGWRRCYAKLSGTSVTLFAEKNSVDDVLDTIELCPVDGYAKVVEAVSHSEMTWPAKSDLPYIFKIESHPLTTCWPKRDTYIMAESFPDKLSWIYNLEKIIKANSPADEDLRGYLILSIDESEDVDFNSVCFTDVDTFLIGAEEGLYMIDMLDDTLKPKTHIKDYGPVTQIELIESHNMILIISGNDHRLSWIELNALNSVCRGEVQFMADIIHKLHPIDDIHGAHKFVTSVADNGISLCVAMANRIAVLRWNSGMKTFCMRKELPCSETCTCALFTKNSLIVGTDKFYDVDLLNFTVEEFVDESDPSLLRATCGAFQNESFPIAIFQVSPANVTEEYLLCFHEFGVFVDSFGQRSRKNEMKWSMLPLNFAFSWPYLYVIHCISVEVFEIIVHKEKCFAVSTFVGMPSPRYLGLGVESGTIVIASVKDKRVELRVLYGEAAIKKKSGKLTASTHEHNPEKDENSSCASEFSFTSSVIEAIEQPNDQTEPETSV